jgi:glucokinase
VTYCCILIYSAYGCEVGSSAIKFIPTGGMFVTGGLTPKNIKFIEGQDSPFMKAYHDKGRVKPVLENVPIFAVMVEDLGVRGAHKCAVLVRVLYSET